MMSAVAAAVADLQLGGMKLPTSGVEQALLRDSSVLERDRVDIGEGLPGRK